jgi:V/A-type H+-transporting ATPase subunit C
MAGSPYASALGRIKAYQPTLLPKETYGPLVAAKDLTDVTKLLEPTIYGVEIAQSGASYQGAPLLEVAINRTFVRRNRLAYEASPFAGRPLVGAYLRRWDIQNIGLILAAKAQGRPIADTETFLVSSRDIPAGLFAGTMTIDDFRVLLQQPTLEAVAQALVKFGYGGVLLPRIESYNRTHDVFPLLAALDRYYYEQVLEAARFYQGDEWVVRQFLQSEIDVRNVLLLLKGKDAGLPIEPVLERFLEGGTLLRANVAELYGARTAAELVTSLEGRFPALPQGNLVYEQDRSLTGFESALLTERAVRELKRMRAYPLSVSILFTFLLLAELERTDLRRIVYGKLYGIPDPTIQGLLIVPKLP